MGDNNKGFSLIELIIVIAMMAVAGGFLTYSFSMVTGQHARQCATNLSSVLDKAKNYAMTKSGNYDAYVEILKDDEGYQACYYVPKKPVKTGAVTADDYFMLEQENIGNKAVVLKCHFKDGSSVTISETNHIRIYYDRISGAFKESVAIKGVSEVSGYCTKIEIVRGKTYEITLISATGKHTVERVN